MAKKTKLSEFAKKTWKESAIYFLEERALPSLIDGLKPSQRFIIYSAIKNAKDKAIKIVEIAGPVSSYGYHHGEVNAQGAACNMGMAWNNNQPLLEGRGNFGSRLIQEASSPRYIFAKLHSNFHNLYTDFNILPDNIDPDTQTPQYYLPIIPVVLLNGVKGTATGYATNILPYDIKDVIKLCKEYISGKDISKRKLVPHYPKFNGRIEANEKDGWDLIGTWEQPSKTKLVITEIPFQYDRESYIGVLDELLDKEAIVDYTDQCNKNGFRFSVTLKRDFDGDIEKVFKLRRSVKENLNVIDHTNRLREYDNPINVIKDFCDIRLPYVQARIDTTISNLKDTMSLIMSKIKFIKAVIDNKIIFKNKSKQMLTQALVDLKFPANHIDSLLTMNFYHLTVEEMEKLGNKYNELEDKLAYFKSTTAEKEYLIDLDRITKEYKS
jgi:DNA gyrase/topoisomerase IV subunit A